MNTAMETKPLRLHLGTDNALATVTIPINLIVNGNSPQVDVKFNLNAVYANPNTIDLNTDNNRQSTSADDATWIANTKANLSNSFTATVK